MKKKILSLITILALGFALVFGVAACGGSGGSGKTVKKIEMDTLPTVVEYYVDDTFSAEGGVILVTYTDDSTEKVALTASGVELTAPDMSKTGNKTITVTYGGKRTRFNISVANKGFTLTYNHNYDGAQNTSETVVKNSVVETPATPTRSGYTFYKWYADAACTQPYNFAKPITDDTTVYAAWKEDGATYYEATYSLNYYGVAPAAFTQIVKSGEQVKDLALTPVRAEFNFDGWYTDEAGTTAFTDKAITADTTIYAKWTKTKTGTSTYTFEAENTDLSGKVGPGFSGTSQEGSMIVGNATASGGKAVSYMYKNGNSLEFYIASDEAVNDATIVLSFAAEMDNISFTSSEFKLLVNDIEIPYDSVTLANNNTFRDAVTVTGISLKKGANLIQLKVNNSKKPLGDASTYAATAPMVDCVKITTSAVLIWDANRNLPMAY